MIEHDGEAELETLEGLEARPLLVFAYLHSALDAKEALGRRLLLDPCGLDQKHEWSRASIHDRHLGAREIDVGVVDPEPCERRHQMLDRGDLDSTVLQCAAQARIADFERIGAHIHWTRSVDAAKHDA